MVAYEIVEIGTKRNVKHGKELCSERDFATLEDIDDSDYVVLLRGKSKTQCFVLQNLARYFVDTAVSFNVYPRHPYNGDVISKTVYADIVQAARRNVIDFDAYVRSEVAQLPPIRQAFVEGVEPDASAMALGEHVTVRRPRRAPSLDTWDMDDILNEYDWATDAVRVRVRQPPPPPPPPPQSPRRNSPRRSSSPRRNPRR